MSIGFLLLLLLQSVPTGDLGAAFSGELTRQLRLYYALLSVSLVSVAPRCSGDSSCSSSGSCSCGCGCCFAAATLQAGEEAMLRCFPHPYKQVVILCLLLLKKCLSLHLFCLFYLPSSETLSIVAIIPFGFAVVSPEVSLLGFRV